MFFQPEDASKRKAIEVFADPDKSGNFDFKYSFIS